MNKKVYKVFFYSLVVASIIAIFFVLDSLPIANAAIRVVEAEASEPVYDYSTDDSYQRYLSVDTPFSDVNYIPGDLSPIDSAFTANTSKTFKLRQEAGVQFADMARHFRNDFRGDKLWIASAYRSNDLQQYMLKK